MLDSIVSKIDSGSPLNEKESMWCLSDDSDLWTLGSLADRLRCRLHPPGRMTYQLDRNINYTNICVTGCRFCAFSRPPGHPDGWTLSISDIISRVTETVNAGGTGILLQGGHNPDIPFDYYIDLLKALKARFPTIHLHAFSPPEIIAFSEFFSMAPVKVLSELIEAGLDSLPGGGAEILANPTRSKIAPLKCSAERWLDIMRTAHHLGLKSTATMVIGFGETLDERLEHLLSLRNLQDETSGFTAFIPWTFQPDNTSMSGEFPHGGTGGSAYLRIQAAARLILHNIPHHQVSWVTQGLDLGAVALKFGADDFSSIMMEEQVVAATGAGYSTTHDEMCRIIQSSGYKPVKRLTLYQNILHA